MTGPSDHVLRNRAAWDRLAADYAGPGLRNWAAAEPGWGIWKVAETQLGILPPSLADADCLELGTLRLTELISYSYHSDISFFA